VTEASGRILVIEDNRDFGATLRINFEREGYDVALAHDGAQGLELATAEPWDLVVLDLMLPSMNGFGVLQRLRDSGVGTPVLVTTALGTEDDKIRAFALGADDYVVKPCGLRELLARVRVLMKRGGAQPDPDRVKVQVADILVDLSARVVSRGGADIRLRPKEFDLLAALIRHRGRVLSRADLLREVWGYSEGAQSRTLETHLAALRDRLGDDPRNPTYVVTVRGAGYRLGGA
jgi:two-component system alkaline phosphatase synthesis response regulator PhoP